MKKNIQVGSITAAPGEIKLGKLDCGYLPDSSVVSMPLIVINGSEEGPTILLSCCMHGTEVPGMEVIRRVTREIVDPKKLRGTIIAAPILNPYAYNYHVMNTPQDGYNLNRVFPGESDSLLSHRLADLIFTELVGRSDCIIDFHANPSPALNFTIVKRGNNMNEETFKKSMGMADAFGMTVIEMITEHESHRTGTIGECAADNNVPSITLELLYWRRQDEESVAAGVVGTLNVLKYFNMIDGEIENVDVQKFEGHLTRTELTADKGGVVHYHKSVGQWVKKGELIGVIRDPWGDIIDEIIAPIDSWILAWPLLANQTCTTGDLLAMFAFPKE